MILFFRQDVPASATALALYVAGYAAEDVYHATAAAPLSVLYLLCTATLTGGTATATASVNGTTAATATLSSGENLQAEQLTIRGLAPGDRVTVSLTTSPSFLPAGTADILAVLK